jgi:DNA-directed RNA polymerase subunit M/transcription elongation factor TFIIS
MATKFCDTCEKLMEYSIEMSGLASDIDQGLVGMQYDVIFKCPMCGPSTRVVGEEQDVKLYSFDIGGSSGHAMKASAFNKNLKLIAHDPTYAKIKQKCTVCKMPYMTLVRTGADEQVIMICKCGGVSTYAPDEDQDIPGYNPSAVTSAPMTSATTYIDPKSTHETTCKDT